MNIHNSEAFQWAYVFSGFYNSERGGGKKAFQLKRALNGTVWRVSPYSQRRRGTRVLYRQEAVEDDLETLPAFESETTNTSTSHTEK